MKAKGEAGFTYIDVMCAGVILSVGILALLSAITSSIVQTKGQEKQVSAKQISTTTLESVMSVKETDAARLGWDKVANVSTDANGNAGPGIFLTGFQDVTVNPGADEIIGTADDDGGAVAGFQRRIVITDICDPDRPSANCNPAGIYKVRIRSVEVTINYFVGSILRQEKLNTILTNY